MFFFAPLQSDSDESTSGSKYLAAIEAAKKATPTPTEFTFTERDSMLYNLGVGAKRSDLKYVL